MYESVQGLAARSVAGGGIEGKAGGIYRGERWPGGQEGGDVRSDVPEQEENKSNGNAEVVQ